MRNRFAIAGRQYAVADGTAGTDAAAKAASDAAAAKVVSDAAAAKTASDAAAAKVASDAAAAKVVSDAAAAAAAGKSGTGVADGTQDGTATPKAPAKYELSIPAGGHVDQADVDAIATIARAKDWTNDEAQAVLAEHAREMASQTERFLTGAKAHAEIGGAHFETAQTHTRAVLDKFLPAGTPEGDALRAGLNKTGYGNWTPLVVLLSRIGKAMAEDTPLARSAAGSQQANKTVADVLYGGTKAGA